VVEAGFAAGGGAVVTVDDVEPGVVTTVDAGADGAAGVVTTVPGGAWT
jgi:hypothetical protein